MTFKPISISLSPNTEKDDIFLAFKLLFKPWLWKKGNAVKEIEEEFKKHFNVKYTFAFNSGRTALYAICKTIESGNIALQAFTCNAVPNPIIWASLTPNFVDAREDDFNIDAEDLKKKINKDTKAVIIQHTFGMPADIDKIAKICRENNLLLIEDCAHSLGAEFNEKKVGTFGDVSFFSFSRDKIISSVYGGIAITNNPLLAQKLEKAQDEFDMPSLLWIKQQLLHPILLNWIIMPIYAFIDLGKAFLIISQWLHILSKAVHYKEKRGERPDYFPKKFPNALAIIALKQFRKLEKFNLHREKLADFYYNALKNTEYLLPSKFNNRKNVFLRFTIRHKNAHSIIYSAWKKENLLIGDWYTTPIAPYDTKPEKVGYIGGCPNAEKLSKETFNLPTHINITEKDAKRIVNFLLSYGNKRN